MTRMIAFRRDIQALWSYTWPRLQKENTMRRLLIVLLFFCPLTGTAQEADSGGPLFMKHLLGEREFYEPWGIGIDFFTMDQDYAIKSLQFDLPGVSLPDASLIDVTNEIQHFDLKLDVWLTPFLNVFGVLGRVDADTLVDLSNVPIIGLPVPLGVLPVSYDGTVYGLGFTLAYGSEKWFTSLTSTWTDTNLSGDFDSSVSSFTAQPRIGLLKNKWAFWVGGMYLKTDEQHQGAIQLPIPGVPPVPFNVELESAKKWNYTVGVGHVFNPKAMLYLEYGFGDRTHTLFNFTYRF
jgi:hypothetical protein